ncbi:Uncharacterised protein [Mycobacteroides abscessus subsp. abscessus]|nr:Uncharacterised protein [Mycobacteroides abscessus subsp. abscessus]
MEQDDSFRIRTHREHCDRRRHPGVCLHRALWRDRHGVASTRAGVGVQRTARGSRRGLGGRRGDGRVPGLRGPVLHTAHRVRRARHHRRRRSGRDGTRPAERLVAGRQRAPVALARHRRNLYCHRPGLLGPVSRRRRPRFSGEGGLGTALSAQRGCRAVLPHAAAHHAGRSVFDRHRVAGGTCA